MKHVVYYPSLKVSLFLMNTLQLKHMDKHWWFYLLHWCSLGLFFTHGDKLYLCSIPVRLPEDLLSCRAGNRNFLMGIRTRTGLFLWPSMKVGLDSEDWWIISICFLFLFFMNMVHQKFKLCMQVFFFPLLIEELGSMNYGYYETHHGQDLIDTHDKSFVYVNKSGICWCYQQTQVISVRGF